MTNITLPRATVEQALEALKYLHEEKCNYMRRNNLGDPLREDAARLALPAIATLRAALAQQAEPVEPYCYVYEYDGVFGLHREFYPLSYNGMKPSRTVPVYTAPPQRRPLTDEEIEDIYLAWDVTPGRRIVGLVRAIERAHGIGEEK